MICLSLADHTERGSLGLICIWLLESLGFPFSGGCYSEDDGDKGADAVGWPCAAGHRIVLSCRAAPRQPGKCAPCSQAQIQRRSSFRDGTRQTFLNAVLPKHWGG